MKKIIVCLAILVLFGVTPAWSDPYVSPDSIVDYGTGQPNEASEKGYLADYLGLTIAEVEALYVFDKDEDVGAEDYKDLAFGFNPGFSWDYAIVKVDGPNDYWYLFMDDNATGFLSNGDNILTTPFQGSFVNNFDLIFNEGNYGISHISWFKTTSQVPEPMILLLLGIGLVGVAGARKMYKK